MERDGRDSRAYESEQFPDWGRGATLLVSSACRAAVGDWDERYFLYSEETDFLRRVRAAGLSSGTNQRPWSGTSAAAPGHRMGFTRCAPSIRSGTTVVITVVPVYGLRRRGSAAPASARSASGRAARIPRDAISGCAVSPAAADPAVCLASDRSSPRP